MAKNRLLQLFGVDINVTTIAVEPSDQTHEKICAVYNPTPLQSFPPQPEFNGIDITLSLGHASSISSGDDQESRKKAPQIIPQPDFNGVSIAVKVADHEPSDDNDQKAAKFCTIDTSSKSCIVDADVGTPVSTNYDPTTVYSPIPLQCFHPQIFPKPDFGPGSLSLSHAGSRSTIERRKKAGKRKRDQLADFNGVDTTLSLGPDGSRSTQERRKKAPQIIPQPDSNGVDTTLSLSARSSVDDQDKRAGKRKFGEEENMKKRESRKRKCGEDQENKRPIVPLEDIPGLLEMIEACNGTRPVFVYGKMLKTTDVSKEHTRLFVTSGDNLSEFLTNDEAAALKLSKQGIDVFAIDPPGNSYNLRIRIWGSLGTTVINSGWNKVTQANNVEEGDWIQIWGYRENGKPCLAFYFVKPNSGSRSSNGEGTSKVHSN